jgi:hypothetical protein
MQTTTANGRGDSAAQIGVGIFQGQEFPIFHGWNDISGFRAWFSDTHHFPSANVEFREKGWKFEADAEWARERDRISAEIYWGSVNPWAN